MGCLAGAGCTGDSGDDAERAAAKAARTPVDLSTVGVIRGVVRLDGPPPPRLEEPMAGACARQHDGAVLSSAVLVSKGLVQNAFVHVEGLDDLAFPDPEGEVVIDQKGCIYIPRVVGVRVDQPLVFLNSDPFLHNVHTVPEINRGKNFAMPAPGMRKEIVLKKPEVMVTTKCDAHPWMRAYIGALDHPCFAVSAADGSFEIGAVPPGEHVVAIWHEVFGTQTQSVTVSAGGEVVVDFTLRPPA